MTRLLLRALPREWRAAIEGDLQEESRRRGHPPWQRRLWVAWQIAILAVRLPGARAVDRLAAASPPAPRRWLGDAVLDVRHGARRWRARPIFAAAAVATLAIGVGSTAALFSIVDGVLLKPLPYPSAERLVTVHRTYPDWVKDPILSSSWDRISLAWPEFFHITSNSRTIDALAVVTTRVTILGGGPAQELRVGVASASFFPLLGVRPALGSLFSPGDDLRDPSTAIVSYDTWQSRFGGDPGLVGRTVHLESKDRVIVGVLPRSFTWGSRLLPYHLWVPLSAIPEDERQDNNRNLDAIARLRPGSTLAETQDEMSALLREHFRYDGATGGRVSPLFQRQLDRVRKPLLLLLVGAVLLLAIACANVAGLLIADATSRQGEMAVRVSLGAGRGRLLRQLFAEGLLLAAVGSAAGLIIALWGVRALVALAPNNLPRLAEIAVDYRVVAFAASAGVLTALLFAILPALGFRGPASALRSAGRANTARRRATSALAFAQVAFAVALLTGAGLFARSLMALESVDAGFARTNLLTLRAWVPPSRTSDPARIAEYFRQAREALAVLPGVTDVAMTSNLAFGSGRSSTTITLSNPRAGRRAAVEAQRRLVSPDYFRTMRMTIVEGRELADTDVAGAPAVAVVSRAMARRVWPDGAIGQRFTYDRRDHEVVGVVNDIRDLALDTPTEATFYLSTAQNRVWPTMRLIARTTGDPAAIAGAARAAISQVAADVPIEDVTTMHELVYRSTSDQRYRATLMGVFAAVAVVLAGVGLYGTLARRVVDRHREIGVRLALGARPTQVRRLFLVEGLSLAAAGTAAGIPAALGFGKWAASLLFGVEPSDPTTLACVTLAIGAVAVLATYLPAARASRLDPQAVLRE